MTSIATMEAFSALAPGELITVGTPGQAGHTWERVENGWQRDGFTLEDLHFVGEVSNGRVVLGVAKQAGQVWTNEGDPHWGYSHLLLSHDSQDQGWWTVRVMDGQFQQVVKVQEVPGKLVTGVQPAWVPFAQAMGRMYVEQATRTEAFRTALTNEQVASAAVRQELASVRSRVQQGLHAIVRENEPLRESIDSVLTENGMLASASIKKVTATATVFQYVNVGTDALNQALTEHNIDGSVVEAQRMLVPYTRVMEFDVETHETGCICGQVTRNMVRQRLRDEGIDYYDVRLDSRTCENHGNGPDPF